MRPPVRSSLARITAIALLSAAPAALAVTATPAMAQSETVTVEFRTALEPYGSFRHVDRWGEVWVPSQVARDWRPYTVGHWVYSGDYGWYWISDQEEAPWGWVVFHYGRWVWIDDIGWAWVPGNEWGPAWVDWRRGDRYVGWAPLAPEEIVVEVRDDPHYWIFVQPHDFLATRIATVIAQPQPVILRETVVVNETVVVRDRGFAVNPGIEPAYLAAEIGRAVPEYQVRPRVLAGTAHIQDAIQVSADELRREDFRRTVVQETNIHETHNVIRPAASVPPPRPLAGNEHGRLGPNPPRAASGVAEQTPSGATPESPRGGSERGATAPEQQRGVNERGAAGPTPEKQGGSNQKGATGPLPEQQHGVNERGALRPTPEQQRGTTQRGATGPLPEQQHGVNERGPTNPTAEQHGRTEHGPSGATPEPQHGLNQPEHQLGPNERGKTGERPEQRGPHERGGAGLIPEQQGGSSRHESVGSTPPEQHGPNQAKPTGALPEERGVREHGATAPVPEQRHEPTGALPQERGAREHGATAPVPEQRHEPTERGAGGPERGGVHERGAGVPPKGGGVELR